MLLSIMWTGEVYEIRNLKHAGIKYQYVCAAVPSGKVRVAYTSSVKNRADGLTKALVGDTFWDMETAWGCKSTYKTELILRGRNEECMLVNERNGVRKGVQNQ